MRQIESALLLIFMGGLILVYGIVLIGFIVFLFDGVFDLVDCFIDISADGLIIGCLPNEG